jgi:hypothetical protein
MERFQATAVRVCGIATLVTVLLAAAELSASLLGLTVFPKLQMAMGVAVLVALTGFVLANVRSRAAAESVSLSAATVVAVLSALYVYKVLASPVGPFVPAGPSLNIVDAALVCGLLALMVVMCRGVWSGGRAASAA